MAKDPALLTPKQLKREYLITVGLRMAVGLFAGFLLMVMVVSRGRFVAIPPLLILVILGAVGVGYAAITLTGEARELKEAMRREKSLPPAAVEKTEMTYLEAIKTTVKSLPSHTEPAQVALFRLTEETAEELAQIVQTHRKNGTENSLEPTKALRELARLASEASTGLAVVVEANPSDALTRAQLIKFTDES